MCKPAVPTSTTNANNVDVLKRERPNSARSRRRERRKEERRAITTTTTKTNLNSSSSLSLSSLSSSSSLLSSASLDGNNCSTESGMTANVSSRNYNTGGDAGNSGALGRSSRRRRKSGASLVSSDGSTSCHTPERRNGRTHEGGVAYSSNNNNNNNNGNCGSTRRKTRGRKRKLPKKSPGGAKQEQKPAVVEVEEVAEEEKLQYVAMDCEMVGVGKYGTRSALARVSITDWEGDVLLDKYVKVDEPVTDFRTFVSGITETDLQSESSITFEKCQDLVLDIIGGKVVVGHALKNDFNALRISHPWYMIRDTARFEPFMKEDPLDKDALVAKKLRDLARDKLGMTIQEEGKHHDSIEDATAAMELYKKARKKWEKAIEWKMNKTNSILKEQEYHSDQY